MELSITGGPNLGSGVGTSLNKHAYYTYLSANDDFSLIRGAHQFSFGASEMRALVSSLANAYSPGVYTFNGQTTGLGQADFFAGNLASDPPGGSERPVHSSVVLRSLCAGYLEGDTPPDSELWRALGTVLPHADNAKQVYTFSLARFYAGTVSSVWTNAPPGFYYPGDPGFSGNSGINASWSQFPAPHRCGFRSILAMEKQPFERERELPTISSTGDVLPEHSHLGSLRRQHYCQRAAPLRQSLEHHAGGQPVPLQFRSAGREVPGRVTVSCLSRPISRPRKSITGIWHWRGSLHRAGSLRPAIWEAMPSIYPTRSS